MAMTAEAYGESPSEERGMTYFQDLMDLPLNKIIKAFGTARMRMKFFPRIAQLREYALEQAEQEFEATPGQKLIENFMTSEERRERREQERDAAFKALHHIYQVIDSQQVQWKREQETREMTEDEKIRIQERKNFLKAQLKEL